MIAIAAALFLAMALLALIAGVALGIAFPVGWSALTWIVVVAACLIIVGWMLYNAAVATAAVHFFRMKGGAR